MHISILDQFPIRRGSHPTREDGLCAMETVAWLAGERHSDDPQCTCPVIASFVRALNDSLPSDAHRARYLRPLVPRLVNTFSGDLRLRRLRAFQVADYGARVLAPMLLEARGNQEAAARMRALLPIQNRASAKAAQIVAQDVGAARAVCWPLMMAARNGPAINWVPSVVQLVREIGSEAGYQAAVQLVVDLVGAPSAKTEKPLRRSGRFRRHLGRLPA